LIPGGSVRAINAPLESVITTAWQIPDFELADVPGWAKSERWDIEAKGSGDTPPPVTLNKLKSLLADRFHLRVHTETREMPVYALLIAKGRPKLPPAREECWNRRPVSHRPRRWRAPAEDSTEAAINFSARETPPP